MPWKEVIEKLNGLGIGKFDFEETDDKVTFIIQVAVAAMRI